MKLPTTVQKTASELQRSTAGTKNSTHGDQLYIGLYWGSKVRTNPHSTQILAAFVLGGTG